MTLCTIALKAVKKVTDVEQREVKGGTAEDLIITDMTGM